MSDVREICNLSDEAFETRRKELREDLAPRVRSRESLADGVALGFESTVEMQGVLDEFVAFERECCPGLELSVQDRGDALRLEIHGIDPEASVFAGVGESAGPVAEAAGEGGRPWLRVLRTGGLGTAGAFFLFCVVPMGLVAVLGASLAAPFAALDSPWAVAGGGLVFGALLWRWERRRAAARASESGCGC